MIGQTPEEDAPAFSSGASKGSLQLLLFAFVTTTRKLIGKRIIRPNESALY